MHAPSGGNCQPWHFVRRGDRFEVHHVRDRSESLLDADGFAGLVSVGMAVEGMALAAAEQGRCLHMEATGAASDHVATLTFTDGAAPDPLHAQLGARFTDRRLPERVPVPGAVEAALRRHLPPGLHLELVTDAAALDELGHHIGAVDRVRFLHPDLHREMWDEVRWSDADAQARPDGISLAEMAVGPGDEPVLRLLRRPDVAAFLRRTGGGDRLGDLAEKWVASAAAVGLFSSDTTDPGALLTAGRHIHRVWLEAVAQGFAIQPIGVAAYMVRHLGTPLQEGYRPRDREILAACDDALTRGFPGANAEGRLLLFRLLAGGTRYAPKTRRPLTDCGS
jgi:nitroreductase